MPKVSVIITTHNRPHLLRQAIESAKAAGADIELIVVDDASTDDTSNVCRELSGIRYVRVERNQKVAGARNIGILASTADYISFLDDDDVRFPGSLDFQLAALEAEPAAGLVYAQAMVENQKDPQSNFLYPSHPQAGDIFWLLLSQNFIPCGSVVFRRSCLSSIGLLDADIPGIDDWDLWIRIAEVYPVIALSRPVMTWRGSTPISKQGTSRASELVTLSTRQFQREWMQLPRAAGATRIQRREAWQRFSANMAKHLVSETITALQYRCFIQAQRHLNTLLRLHPAGLMWAIGKSSKFRFLSQTGTNVQNPNS